MHTAHSTRRVPPSCAPGDDAPGVPALVDRLVAQQSPIDISGKRRVTAAPAEGQEAAAPAPAPDEPGEPPAEGDPEDDIVEEEPGLTTPPPAKRAAKRSASGPTPTGRPRTPPSVAGSERGASQDPDRASSSGRAAPKAKGKASGFRGLQTMLKR